MARPGNGNSGAGHAPCVLRCRIAWGHRGMALLVWVGSTHLTTPALTLTEGARDKIRGLFLCRANWMIYSMAKEMIIFSSCQF